MTAELRAFNDACLGDTNVLSIVADVLHRTDAAIQAKALNVLATAKAADCALSEVLRLVAWARLVPLWIDHSCITDHLCFVSEYQAIYAGLSSVV